MSRCTHTFREMECPRTHIQEAKEVEGEPQRNLAHTLQHPCVLPHRSPVTQACLPEAPGTCFPSRAELDLNGPIAMALSALLSMAAPPTGTAASPGEPVPPGSPHRHPQPLTPSTCCLCAHSGPLTACDCDDKPSTVPLFCGC